MSSKAPSEILLVDSSNLFTAAVERRIRAEIKAEIATAETRNEAARLMEENPGRFFLAVLDTALPDDPEGEIVDEALQEEIPVVALTETYDVDACARLHAKPVIEIITKNVPLSFGKLVSTVRRLHLNRDIKVLVVDPDDGERSNLCALLKLQQFTVCDASDGAEALDILATDPSIRLVMTAGDMPQIDGFELAIALRERRSREALAIIGTSPGGTGSLSSKFIHHGASDVLATPFTPEELFCRVSNCLDAQEGIAAQDLTTGLANRQQFRELSTVLLAASRRSSLQPILAVLEIDDFASLEQTYGAEIGEQILADVGHRLGAALLRATDITARSRRDEFAVFAYDMKIETVAEFFESIRQVIESVYVDTIRGPILATVSIGVCTTKGETFDSMLAGARTTLGEAKQRGRNSVALDKAA